MKIDKSMLELYMARKCMSVIELAKAAKISRETVYGIWKGENAKPETVGKIAKALDVDPIFLLNDKNDTTNSDWDFSREEEKLNNFLKTYGG